MYHVSMGLPTTLLGPILSRFAPLGCYLSVRGTAEKLNERSLMPRQYIRLSQPLVRHDEELVQVSWDEALDRAADGLRSVRDSLGGQAFGMFSCSKATNEMNYMAQKFARVVMSSNNIDSCNRT